MKSFLFALLACAGVLATASKKSTGTPIDQVVALIKDLAGKIEKDGEEEQASYDKYACWVEDTLQRKAADISAAKELLPQLDDAIKKGKAEIASHGSEIAQLQKDIAQNLAAQKEAKALRNKEHADYAGDRAESEQCIGALEAATTVLTGAGTKKGGFLQQLHEAQLLSVAMGVGKVLQQPRISSMASDESIEAVKRFVQNPGSFAKEGVSALQSGQNPFGDYAPQSTQIQGILKGMYDAFTSDLEKDNAAESNAQKSFESLMATKTQELKTLQATLQKQEKDSAAKTKKLAEDEVLRDDTTEQLAADEKFFEETKNAAEAKATEWSSRTRLRTEELAGMEGAIQILSGGSKVFEEATTTFVQLKATQRHTSRQQSYVQLRNLAAKYQSSSLASLVEVMKNGGHFDKVMIMIDHMMAELRKEEQDDIEHRDRCENGQNANNNEMEDVEAEIKKTEKKMEHLDRSIKEKQDKLKVVNGDIAESKKNLKDMLDLRNKDNADFKRALEMDAQAVSLISSAVVRLSKYYKENKIPLSLVQAPEYSEDPDKAPETTFSGGDAHQSESTGVVSILEMIKADLQKEMREGKADEAKAQAEYEKQSGALQDALNAQKKTKVSLEQEIAGLDEAHSNAEGFKAEKNDDLSSEEDMKKSLKTDCSWVQTHFDKPRDARKQEMAGLVEAKNFLAGVASGEPVLAP
jgi:peptidoglycan hydrolase CwlO-like protein